MFLFLLMDKFVNFLNVHLIKNIRHFMFQFLIKFLNLIRLKYYLRKTVQCSYFYFSFGVVSEDNYFFNYFISRISYGFYLILLVNAVNYIKGLIFQKCVSISAHILHQLLYPHSLFCRYDQLLDHF